MSYVTPALFSMQATSRLLSSQASFQNNSERMMSLLNGAGDMFTRFGAGADPIMGGDVFVGRGGGPLAGGPLAGGGTPKFGMRINEMIAAAGSNIQLSMLKDRLNMKFAEAQEEFWNKRTKEAFERMKQST